MMIFRYNGLCNRAESLN